MIRSNIKNIFNIYQYNLPTIECLNINFNKKTNIRNIGNFIENMNGKKIVWIDMEMTGLNVFIDKIMEIACIITDEKLNIIAEGPNIIINQTKDDIKSMDEWCTCQHGISGLSEECLKSKTSLSEAENQILNFVSTYVGEKISPLAGNSVYMDRLFLRKYMPTLDNYLHYRIIDVSTIKELCRMWNYQLYKSLPKKEFSHRALNDIKESISELKYYKNHFFNF